MKSQGGISYDNAAVAACSKHLLQFAVDQRCDDYTLEQLSDKERRDLIEYVNTL